MISLKCGTSRADYSSSERLDWIVRKIIHVRYGDQSSPALQGAPEKGEGPRRRDTGLNGYADVPVTERRIEINLSLNCIFDFAQSRRLPVGYARGAIKA